MLMCRLIFFFKIKSKIALIGIMGRDCYAIFGKKQDSKVTLCLPCEASDHLNENDKVDYSSLDGIVLTKESRFGNSIRQIANSIRLCKANNIGKIYLPYFWWIKDGVLPLNRAITIYNKKLLRLDNDEKLLVGRFFELKKIDSLALQEINNYEVLRGIENLINIDFNYPPLSADHLVIHIRSGDIFNKIVHPNYGQPPLSFYQKVMKYRKWDRVTIVSENAANPVIEYLLRYSVQHFETEIRIFRDLKSDIEYLLRAKNLVASCGTFCRGIAALSYNLREVHSFENGFESWGNSKINQCRWIDSLGEYKKSILSSNWSNSKSQRTMMINYPVENLCLM